MESLVAHILEQNRIGSELYGRGRPMDALPYFTSAINMLTQISRNKIPEDNQDVPIGDSKYHMGYFALADIRKCQSSEISNSHHDLTPPDESYSFCFSSWLQKGTLTVMHNIALSYFAAEDWRRAEAMMRLILDCVEDESLKTGEVHERNCFLNEQIQGMMVTLNCLLGKLLLFQIQGYRGYPRITNPIKRMGMVQDAINLILQSIRIEQSLLEHGSCNLQHLFTILCTVLCEGEFFDEAVLAMEEAEKIATREYNAIWFRFFSQKGSDEVDQSHTAAAA